jgi:hypothetical protein
LTIDGNGKLTKGTAVAFAASASFFPSSMAMTPNGSCLFVAEGIGLGSPRVAVFSVGANGALTLVADQVIANVTAGAGITSVAATATNLYMTAADAVPNQLITVPINPTTCALGAAGAPSALGASCTNYQMTTGDPADGDCCGLTTVQVDPGGKFVYISSDFGGTVAGYTLDATGTHFTSRQQVAVPGGTGVTGGVFAMQFTRDAKFLYIGNDVTGLTAFNYNATTGVLGAEITTSPLDAASSTDGCVVIDRTDHLIYTGPIDEYFGFDLGRLAYRGQRRSHAYLPEMAWHQPVAQVNHPDPAVAAIRTLEWKHMMEPELRDRLPGTLRTVRLAKNPQHRAREMG